ncbi:uncharacterized protein UV8b_03352 [Ustilaginoidea virens]|uniref:Uncharacterized protein n=1 Tax=Ustilaginoidea virens TaxID=1159556 RepID=A0A8E5MGQ4_USTVR|nr:uncharacterized protein UV8b_03352 [Ustilaginoidea virens]QUC19111.1 hypothetical protein UV8b_03352 [Ustilaginoidea virens]
MGKVPSLCVSRVKLRFGTECRTLIRNTCVMRVSTIPSQHDASRSPQGATGRYSSIIIMRQSCASSRCLRA